MNSLANATPNVYQAKAQATRSRRQAAGKYATAAQKAALSKYSSLAYMRGEVTLTPAELEQLATHPHLLPRQRAQFAALAADKVGL